MVKSNPLVIRLQPGVKDALLAAADSDTRSLSSMAEKILTDWLREHGYLKAPKAKK